MDIPKVLIYSIPQCFLIFKAKTTKNLISPDNNSETETNL